MKYVVVILSLAAAMVVRADTFSNVVTQSHVELPCLGSNCGPWAQPCAGSPSCEVFNGTTTTTYAAITYDVGRVSGNTLECDTGAVFSPLDPQHPGDCSLTAMTAFSLDSPARIRVTGQISVSGQSGASASFSGSSQIFHVNDGMGPVSLVANVPAGSYTMAMSAGSTGGGWSADLTLMVLCPADFDDSGQLAIPDVFAFLNAWFVGDPRTDFNRFGGITVGDIFDFLAAWFAGC